MAVDLEYYRRCRDENPSYQPADAIIHYLSNNIREADQLANQICDDTGDLRLLTWDDCWDIIGKMKPDDAYCVATISEPIKKGHFHTFDGDRFRRIPNPWAYMKDIFYFAADDIVCGKYRISKDLRAVIDAVTEGDFGTCNAKPKTTSKTRLVKRTVKALAGRR